MFCIDTSCWDRRCNLQVWLDEMLSRAGSVFRPVPSNISVVTLTLYTSEPRIIVQNIVCWIAQLTFSVVWTVQMRRWSCACFVSELSCTSSVTANIFRRLTCASFYIPVIAVRADSGSVPTNWNTSMPLLLQIYLTANLSQLVTGCPACEAFMSRKKPKDFGN